MPKKQVLSSLALLCATLTLAACGNRLEGDRDSTASAYVDDDLAAGPNDHDIPGNQPSPSGNNNASNQSGSDSSDSNTPFIDTNPTKSILEARAEATKFLGENGDRQRAVWDHKPGTEAWNNAMLRALKIHRPILETAKDVEVFCPSYGKATSFQKNTCWIRLFSAMARYESNFRPKAIYKESNGANSVGLLMMAPEHCPKANTEEKLLNAEANIECAVPRLARMIEKRGQHISGPNFTGGAAYWSVLRPPHKRGRLHLGRVPHIQEFTRSYMAFREVGREN